MIDGSVSATEALSFYQGILQRIERFPIEWERLILRRQTAELPERDDLRARLAVVDAEIETAGIDVGEVGVDVRVATSLGRMGLPNRDHAMLVRLMEGTASPADGQQFYQAVFDRHGRFPAEWELPIVRLGAAAHPERHDLIAKVAELEQRVGDGVPGSQASLHAGFDRAWARFARVDLNPQVDDGTRRVAREQATDDACALLASSIFTELPLPRQIAVFKAIHDTLMSAPSSSLPIVAELGMRRFRAMLANPALTEADACAFFDRLHGLMFAGISDTQDLRRFDMIVPAFETWLESRHGRHPRPKVDSGERPLTIAYLLHTAHSQRGNAVSPLVLTLAKAHAARTGRRVLLYLVQHVSAGFEAEAKALGIVVRTFEQGWRYDRIDAIAQAMRQDEVDVIVTEQNRAVAAALFVRRVAPRQMWFDTGFPFWSLRALDWTLRPSHADGAREPRTSRITLRQNSGATPDKVDLDDVRRIRAQFPGPIFLLGVFVRLVKLNDAYLDMMHRLLDSNPRFRLIIGGPGDAAMAHAFAARPELAGRVKVVEGNVDLKVHGTAVNAMCDTFPFIGGLACREVMARGTPVISKLGADWDDLLRADRSPDLLAATDDEFIALANRLLKDRSFLTQQKQIALKLTRKFGEVGVMIDDVEAAIVASAT